MPFTPPHTHITPPLRLLGLLLLAFTRHGPALASPHATTCPTPPPAPQAAHAPQAHANATPRSTVAPATPVHTVPASCPLAVAARDAIRSERVLSRRRSNARINLGLIAFAVGVILANNRE